MEDSNFGLCPVVSVNRFDNQVVVADQRRDIVVSDCAYGVPAMISKVIDYEVELVGQKRPEGVVEISIARPLPWLRTSRGPSGLP